MSKSSLSGICLVLAIGWLSNATAEEAAHYSLRWWKGNLHTHSLWSDGDEFPEMIAIWYLEQGYNFLALSDHNVLSRGQRWMPLAKIVQRSDAGVLQRYRARFGDSWVQTRPVHASAGSTADIEVRLKPLNEFRCLVEQAQKFIMIEGEEISDRAEGKPVHMNATNLAETLQPVGGNSVEEVIRNNLRLVLEHERASGREVLPHLNHPNFGYAVTAEDIARVIEEQFFEVYNGHPGVNQLGDEDHPSIESMWDQINALRLLVMEAEPIMGIATDDSHEYHGQPGSRPGRGWVMVRSRFLTPEHLIQAMKAGDFYASSGVELADVDFDSSRRELSLSIVPTAAASFKTEFIAVRKPAGFDPTRGQPVDLSEGIPAAAVVGSVDGLQASYRLRGDELYVRAVVTSSLPHPDPSFSEQQQQAWTQPVGWQPALATQP